MNCDAVSMQISSSVDVVVRSSRLFTRGVADPTLLARKASSETLVCVLEEEEEKEEEEEEEEEKKEKEEEEFIRIRIL